MAGHQGKILPSEVLTDITDATLPVESHAIYKQVEFSIVSCISSYLQKTVLSMDCINMQLRETEKFTVPSQQTSVNVSGVS